MNAKAPAALTENSFLAPAWAPPAPERAAAETALDPATRRRAALFGTVLGLIAIAAAATTGLLIVTGPFHTSLGSLA